MLEKIPEDVFRRPCQPISNHNTLPLTLSSERTNHLSTADIRPKKISKIIKILDQNKAHIC